MRRLLSILLLATASPLVAQAGETPSSPKPFDETVVADFDSP
ncbi:MAG TPA: hypothetical protein VF636_03645 [Sphingomonas sp.]|jgi:hypothetical protein